MSFFYLQSLPICNSYKPRTDRIVQRIFEENVCFIGISSNDILKYPQDGPEK